MADAHRLWGVFERQRGEKGVTDHFDVSGRVVQVTLGFLDIHQGQRHLVLHDMKIRRDSGGREAGFTSFCKIARKRR